jgi:hypothetical protein
VSNGMIFLLSFMKISKLVVSIVNQETDRQLSVMILKKVFFSS